MVANGRSSVQIPLSSIYTKVKKKQLQFASAGFLVKKASSAQTWMGVCYMHKLNASLSALRFVRGGNLKFLNYHGSVFSTDPTRSHWR